MVSEEIIESPSTFFQELPYFIGQIAFVPCLFLRQLPRILEIFPSFGRAVFLFDQNDGRCVQIVIQDVMFVPGYFEIDRLEKYFFRSSVLRKRGIRTREQLGGESFHDVACGTVGAASKKDDVITVDRTGSVSWRGQILRAVRRGDVRDGDEKTDRGKDESGKSQSLFDSDRSFYRDCPPFSS